MSTTVLSEARGLLVIRGGMTIDKFHPLATILTKSYRTMATFAVCLGLRWSELGGLKWQDIDWVNEGLRLERAFVKQIEDEVKTVHSDKPLALDARILDLLKQHKQNSICSAPGDWIFRLAGEARKAASELHVVLGEN
jgi:integrase